MTDEFEEEQYIPTESNPANPGVTIDSAEDCVQQALSLFAKEHSDRARVLSLAAIEGWDTKEVAAFIGRTLGATREYISQCRKYFSKYLEPCQEYLSD